MSAGDGPAGPEVLQHREVGGTGGGKEEDGARRSRHISSGTWSISGVLQVRGVFTTKLHRSMAISAVAGISTQISTQIYLLPNAGMGQTCGLQVSWSTARRNPLCRPPLSNI